MCVCVQEHAHVICMTDEVRRDGRDIGSFTAKELPCNYQRECEVHVKHFRDSLCLYH
jgi:hypothetical protein